MVVGTVGRVHQDRGIAAYSPECVEGEFSEVGYPLDFVTLVVTFERR